MKIIKLALRSILHFRTYSGINLLGLALSLACVITISRYVYGELTVDRFNKKLDRIFVTTVEISTSPGEAMFSGISDSFSEKTLIEHPGVENFTNFIRFESEEIDVDDRKYDAAILLADSNFLKINDYPLISGIDKLSDLHGALITKNFAQKLFGNENPIGKTFRHPTGEIFTISGMIGQLSSKTSLTFDLILSYQLSNYLSARPSPQTIVLLYPGVDYRTVNEQYADFIGETFWGFQMRYQLFPFSKVYFHKNVSKVFKQGNYNNVTMLMAVGALILFAGIINYINICTVVVLRRGRELGIKKVFGAGGQTIFYQLLVENLLMTGLALMAAWLIADVAYPLITNILQLDLFFDFRFNIFLSTIILLSLPVITTLYPFFRFHYSMPLTQYQKASFDIPPMFC